MLHDPLLRKYSAVVVDEAHERTVGTDLVLGFLKKLSCGERSEEGRYPVLKVVVMSATLQTEKMVEFFDSRVNVVMRTRVTDNDGGVDESGNDNGSEIYNERVAELVVPGRQFDVELYHTESPVPDYADAALRSIFQLHYGEPMPGDILVFLTGQEEIDALQKLIEELAEQIPQGIPKVGVLSFGSILASIYSNKRLVACCPSTILCTTSDATAKGLPAYR
jgi:ATP-dependent RNA helicase DHR2